MAHHINQIVVTIGGDPTSITLRDETVALIKQVAPDSTSIGAARFIANEINERLIPRMKANVDAADPPIREEDIQG